MWSGLWYSRHVLMCVLSQYLLSFGWHWYNPYCMPLRINSASVFWLHLTWSSFYIVSVFSGGVHIEEDKPKMKLHSDGEFYAEGTLFKCEVCDREFQSYQFLKIHTWSHTRPFKCDQCQRDFTRPYHLKAHKFTHSEVKPFTCDFCGKSFCTTSHFKKHMQTHTNPQTFNCDLCSSTFTQEHYLKRHKLRHIGRFFWQKCVSSMNVVGQFE